MAPRLKSEALAVYNEFDHEAAAAEPPPARIVGSGRSKGQPATQPAAPAAAAPVASPPAAAAGSSAAQEWLAALARWCEGAEGAQAKAGFTELLRCGARSRDKVTLVANRARQAIGKIFP